MSACWLGCLNIIYGKPYILDVVVVSGASVAQSRDNHYHKPPRYIVLEPEDTKARTRNLQQTNTNGFKLQASTRRRAEAERIIGSWGPGGRIEPNGQLPSPVAGTTIARFPYRLDTKHARSGWIVYPGLEAFKTRVMGTTVHGLTVRDWDGLFPQQRQGAGCLGQGDGGRRRRQGAQGGGSGCGGGGKHQEVLMDRLGIREGDPDDILK